MVLFGLCVCADVCCVSLRLLKFIYINVWAFLCGLLCDVERIACFVCCLCVRLCVRLCVVFGMCCVVLYGVSRYVCVVLCACV